MTGPRGRPGAFLLVVACPTMVLTFLVGALVWPGRVGTVVMEQPGPTAPPTTPPSTTPPPAETPPPTATYKPSDTPGTSRSVSPSPAPSPTRTGHPTHDAQAPGSTNPTASAPGPTISPTGTSSATPSAGLPTGTPTGLPTGTPTGPPVEPEPSEPTAGSFTINGDLVGNEPHVIIRARPDMMFGGVISGAAPGDRFFIISTPPGGGDNRYVQDEVAGGRFEKTISLNVYCQFYDAPEPVEVYLARDEEVADLVAARIELENPSSRIPFSAGEWASIAPRLYLVDGIEVDRRPPATECRPGTPPS